jgi:hypothetical protein
MQPSFPPTIVQLTATVDCVYINVLFIGSMVVGAAEMPAQAAKVLYLKSPPVWRPCQGAWMLTQHQFYDFLNAALTFFATIGTMITVTSAVYAVIALRQITDDRSTWDRLGLAVNIGIAEGFMIGTPVAVLMLILGRQVVSS